MRLDRLGIPLVTLLATFAALAAPAPARASTNLARTALDAQRARVTDARGAVARATARARGLSPALAGALAARAAGPAVVTAPDAAGNAYVAWSEFARDGLTLEVVLLRVASDGTPYPGWPADGLVVADAGGMGNLEALVPDGSAGVIVVWIDQRTDLRHASIYAQRVNASGTALWTANGVLVRQDVLPEIVQYAADGTGGLLATWSTDTGADRDVYAARVDATGARPGLWSSATGLAVCTAIADQNNPVIAGDGAGGAFVAWQDLRTQDGLANVYLQRFDANGAAQWTANGVLVAAGSPYDSPALCSDGGTGAFVFWENEGVSAIQADRVNAAGVLQWGAPVTLSSVNHYGTNPVATPDGAGGAIAHWVDTGLSGTQVRAQRVNASGAAQWGATPVAVAEDSIAYQPDMVTLPDGSGGALFVWPDFSHFSITSGARLRAQKVASGGSAAWGGTGVMLADDMQFRAGVPALDGSGGLFVAWAAMSTTGYPEIRAQHVDASGALATTTTGALAFRYSGEQTGCMILQTDAGGVLGVYSQTDGLGGWSLRAVALDESGAPLTASRAVATGAVLPQARRMAGDGAGGALFAWTDQRGATPEIWAQRLDATGAPLWGASGVSVCTGAGSRSLVGLVSSGSGAYVLWYDTREGATDLWMQYLTNAGAPQWTANGVRLASTAAQRGSAVMVPDGAGGAIVGWTMNHTYVERDSIVAQRIDAAGTRQWGAGGVVVSDYPSYNGLLLEDATVGASHEAIFVASWSVVDTLNATTEFSPELNALRAYKVSGTGTPQWGASGYGVCSAGSAIQRVRCVSDSAGGAYVAWSDDRSGGVDVYLQRVGSGGSGLWTANGIPACAASGWQSLDDMTTLSTGEPFLVWDDHRGADNDVYLQRVSTLGVPVWSNGIPAVSASRGQFNASLAPYRVASPARIFVTWADNRAGDKRLAYVQRFDLNGAEQWTPSGFTATTLSLVASDAESDAVRLTWFASASVAATVERRSGDGPWTAVGNAASDGSGYVRFTDRTVEAGASYDYRLAWTEGERTVTAGQTRVTVPVALAFELAGAVPNPAGRRMTVAFTLPHEGAATLDLLDLAGRRVARRDVGALGAGRHTLALDGATMRAGVYWLRLTQGTQTLRKRTVVVE